MGLSWEGSWGKEAWQSIAQGVRERQLIRKLPWTTPEGRNMGKRTWEESGEGIISLAEGSEGATQFPPELQRDPVAQALESQCVALSKSGRLACHLIQPLASHFGFLSLSLPYL